MTYFSLAYPYVPFKDRILSRVCQLEGGQMVSRSLRDVLRRYYRVEVGMHSYGSLLLPGHSDPHTVIGRYVSVGAGVRRIGASHPIESVSMHPYWYNDSFTYVDSSRDVQRSPCFIGHDSWIGVNTVILPGCRSVGIGSVIGAGSVVTNDVPDFSVVVGSPARVVRERFNSRMIARILESEYWLLEPLEARARLAELDAFLVSDLSRGEIE